MLRRAILAPVLGSSRQGAYRRVRGSPRTQCRDRTIFSRGGRAAWSCLPLRFPRSSRNALAHPSLTPRRSLRSRRLLALAREILRDGGVVLFERGRKHMAAIAAAGSHEIHRVGLLRTSGGANGGGADQGDRRRRQTAARIGIVRPVGAQIDGSQLPVVA